MLYFLWKRIYREVALFFAFFLPAERKRKLERWLRGKEEFRKLELADVVVVSFGKSGRTWLRVLLSRFFQLRFGLSPSAFIGFDNLNRRDPGIPRVFFTHDNYLRDYTGNLDSKTGEDIMALFHELHRAGDTIVLITHNEEIASQAQRRIRIMDGRVTEVGA